MTRRLYDFAAGLVSLVVLAALTVLPPLLLARHVGWPLPTHVPTLSELEHSVRTGIDHQVIVKALALVAWIAWAQIAATVLVETAALARRRAAPSLRVLPGLQPAIGRMVATATLVVTALLPTATATVAAASGPLPSAAAFDAYRAPVTVVLPATPPDPDPTASTLETPPVADGTTVEVQRHDSLWAIAERTLGDGTRWRELRDANIGRVMHDGTTIGPDTELIRPGWSLLVPVAAPTGAAVTPADAAATPLTDPTEDTTDTAPPDTESTPTTADDPAAADTASRATTGEVVAERGDNLWAIARQQLADTYGRAPTEDETVVYWRALLHANQHLLANRDPNLIHPGERFVLPPIDGHQAPTPPVDEPAPDDPAPPAPAPDDPLPDDEHPTAPDPATTTPTLDTAPTAFVPDALPPLTEAPPDEVAPTTSDVPVPSQAQPTTTAESLPSEAGPTVDEVPDDGHHDADDGRLVVLGGAGALGVAATGLAVGITRAARRRRRRDAHLHPEQIDPPTQPDLQRAALAAADDERFDTLESALDDLAGALAAAGAATRPRIVQHGEDHLDVLLATPLTPAPPGWSAEANGAIWTHAPADALPDPRSPVRSVAPLLVTLGRPDDIGGQLHLDLEADTLVSLTGDPTSALAVARSIVTELAYSPLADTINLVLVGDLGTHAAARLDRVTAADTWADVLPDVTAWATQSHRVLAEHHWANPFVARAGSDHDALTPLVVIGNRPPDADEVAALAGLAPAAVAVVSVGEPLAAGTVIDCQPDRLTVTDIGLTCEPQGLDATTVEQIADLLEPHDATPPTPADSNGDPLATEPITRAESDEHEHDHDPPTDAEATNGDRPHHVEQPSGRTNGDLPAHDHAYRDSPAEIVVRVLGDITVEGGTQPLTPKQTAVFAYIALNSPVSGDRIEDAIWNAPTGGSRRKRLSNLLSECRGALGARHLPAAVDGRYSVAPSVVTDLDLFERQVAHAATQPAADAIPTLRDALELVRGPVFTYRGSERWSYAWVDLENWVARWEPKIAAVAQHAVELCLDHGNPTAAIDTAERALAVVPTHSGLTEALMRAHHQRGDHTGVDAVYHAHVAALAQLDLDQPADTTAALYHQLRQPASTGR